jgi:hypothetical protein
MLSINCFVLFICSLFWRNIKIRNIEKKDEILLFSSQKLKQNGPSMERGYLEELFFWGKIIGFASDPSNPVFYFFLRTDFY